MSAIKPTARELLLSLGIGQFNATQIIPFLEIAPATTDPKSPPVILLVRALQSALYEMGAVGVSNTGYLDRPTADALARITGPDWERTSWGGNVQSLLGHRKLGTRFTPPILRGDPPGPVTVPMSDVDLTRRISVSAPTWMFYGAVGYAVYRMMRGRSA